MSSWEEMLVGLGRASYQGAAMVLLVLGVRWAFGARLGPRWRYLFWMVVVVRLLLPVSLPSAWSFFNWIPTPSPIASLRPAPAKPLELPVAAAPRIVPATVLSLKPTLSPVAPASSVEASPLEGPRPEVPVKVKPAEFVASILPTRPVEPSPIERRWRWSETAALAWATGAVLVLGGIGIPLLRFYLGIRMARRIEDPEVDSLLRECQSRVRLRWAPVLCESPLVQTPALFGFLRPRLLLPPGTIQHFPSQELRHVFMHELAHLKRRDLLVNWLLMIVLVVHWFNPLVWLAVAKIRVDRELACDALALTYLEETEARAYGETILRLVEAISLKRSIPCLVGMGEDPGALRARILMIARFRKPTRWSMLTALLVVGFGMAGLTDAQRLVRPPLKRGEEMALSKVPKSRVPLPLVIGNGPILPSPTEPASGVSFLTNAVPKWCLVRVVDAESRQPVAGARLLSSVSYGAGHPPCQLRGSTDGSGNAQLEVSAWVKDSGPITFLVDHPRFAVARATLAAVEGQSIPQLEPALTVELSHGVRIGGAVIRDDGKPMAAQQVWVEASGFAWASFEVGPDPAAIPLPGNLPWCWRRLALTDSQGRWYLDAVPPEANNFGIEVMGDAGASRHFYTGQDVFGRLDREIIQAGSLFSTSAVLRWETGRDLAVLVTDESGRALPEASIIEDCGVQRFDQTFSRITPSSLRKIGGTDRSGRCLLRDQLGVEKLVIAQADGFATATQIVPLQASRGENQAVIPLAKMASRRFRFVDESGVAQEGVTVSTSYSGRETPYDLPWTGVTDARGEVGWKGAPIGSFLVSVAGSGVHFQEREVKANLEFQEVVILRGPNPLLIPLSIEVVDAETGNRIPEAHFFGIPGAEPSIFLYPEPLSDREVAGVHHLEINAAARWQWNELPTSGGAWRHFRVGVVAPGFAEQISPVMAFAGGEQHLRMSLTQKKSSQIVSIYTPDGKVAAGAKLCWTVSGSWGEFPDFDSLDRLSLYGMTRKASVTGEVELPLWLSDLKMSIIHESGIAFASLGELQSVGEVRLEAWGSLEVVWQSERADSGVVNASLRPLRPVIPLIPGWSSRSLTSDKQGRVMIQKLPPREYVVSRRHWDPQDKDSRTVVVKPGEHVRLQIGARGMAVAGICVGAGPEPSFDGPTGGIRALLVRKLPQFSVPKHEHFASWPRWQTALMSWMETEPAKDYLRNEIYYSIPRTRNGSFRLDRVTPGTYELRTGVPLWGVREGFPPAYANKLGQVAGMIEVPDVPFNPSLPALDLGVILTESGVSTLERPAPVDLRGETLSGKPFSIADHRGHLTLLTFWSSWSESSLQAASDYSKLRNELGASDTFQVVGVSMDSEAQAARGAATRASLAGTQLVLTAAQRATLMDQISLTELPRSVLLDRAGRVLMSDIPLEHAKATFQRILATN